MNKILSPEVQDALDFVQSRFIAGEPMQPSFTISRYHWDIIVEALLAPVVIPPEAFCIGRSVSVDITGEIYLSGNQPTREQRIASDQAACDAMQMFINYGPQDNTKTPTMGVRVGEPEVIGKQCMDGQRCQNDCITVCSRKASNYYVPLSNSGLNRDWTIPLSSKT